MFKITPQGITTIEQDDSIIAIVVKDSATHNNIFYQCEKMSMEKITQLLEQMQEK